MGTSENPPSDVTTSKGKTRNHSLDTLRGLMLLFMLVNHIVWTSGVQTPLHLFTFQTFGPFDAAHGFVFLSGFVAAIAYGRFNQAQLWQKVSLRAFTIWRYNAVVVLAICAWVWAVPFILPYAEQQLSNMAGNFIYAPLQTLVASLLWLNQLGYNDILFLYFFFILLVPPVLFLSNKKSLWLLPIAVSGILWHFNHQWFHAEQVYPVLELISDELIVELGYFNWWAWQFLFVLGVVAGNLYAQQRLTKWLFHPILLLVSLIVGAFYVAYQYRWLPGDLSYYFINIEPSTAKPDLHYFRLVGFLNFAYLVSFVIHKWPKALNWKGVNFLGRHSLPVYSYHVVLLYVVSQPLRQLYGQGIWFHIALAACIASMWLPAWLHARHQSKKLQANEPVIIDSDATGETSDPLAQSN